MVEYTITSFCTKDYQSVWPHTIKYLKIICIDYRDTLLIQRSLTNLSQLNDLEVHQAKPVIIFPESEKWKQIIGSPIPSLKNFKFYRNVTLPNGNWTVS